jgi:hypothetical protein
MTNLPTWEVVEILSQAKNALTSARGYVRPQSPEYMECQAVLSRIQWTLATLLPHED